MSSSKDIIEPRLIKESGAYHPINNIIYSLVNFLTDMGFEIIEGPELETEEYNFDMLNIKESHPARQMHDTFYVNKKSHVLRTHTSPVQIRGMLEKKPPISFISAGKVYRKDDDSTHLPMFHQIEGIFVDKNVSFSNFDALKNPSTQIRLFGKPGVSGKRRMGVAVALGDNIENAISKAEDVATSITCEM